MPSFRNVRPCTFLGYEFVGKLASVWNHGHPRPRMYIRVHSWAASLQANSYVFCQAEKRNFLGFSLLGRSRPC